MLSLAPPDLVVTLHEYYGGPHDIEWAFAEFRFYIVQNRPLPWKAPWRIAATPAKLKLI